jgi:glycosyltransferase involved in cell wall biosynthesis
MAQAPAAILLVSTSDILGGAEQVARDLFEAYRAQGIPSWLAVGRKVSEDPDVVLIPNDACRGWFARGWLAFGNLVSRLLGRWPRLARVGRYLGVMGQVRRLLKVLRGHEDFDFPGSRHLLEIAPQRPAVVHCHNLHGAYFDLEHLPRLSQQVPTILTLHDEWLLTGHCAYTFECDRWKSGCVHCPDLNIYPALLRDATAYNWQRKQRIYARSRVYVATPCRWLMDKVEQSMLAAAKVEGRIIPNGIDLSVFRPVDRQAVRAELAVPPDAKVLLFATASGRRNPFKDYQTLEEAMARVAAAPSLGQKILCVALGESSPVRHLGHVEIRYVPFQSSRQAVARYYQAADGYVHSARAETAPLVILEALACGTPVVATAVGGISEQVRGLACPVADQRHKGVEADRATGILVPPGDPAAMAGAIQYLLREDALRSRLAENALQDARARFDLRQQVQGYLEWYKEILARAGS